MSRIGGMPIAVPAGVQVDIKGSTVNVKGPKGELRLDFFTHGYHSTENGHRDREPAVQKLQTSVRFTEQPGLY